MYYDSAYFGMNFFWWLFWIVLWVGFFSLLSPVSRKQKLRLSEKPLDILLRRLANGELTEAEYESRKSTILRDSYQDRVSAKKWPMRLTKPLNT